MYGSTCMCRKAAERGGAMLSQAPDSSNRRTLAGVSVLTRSSGGQLQVLKSLARELCPLRAPSTPLSQGFCLQFFMCELKNV